MIYKNINKIIIKNINKLASMYYYYQLQALVLIMADIIHRYYLHLRSKIFQYRSDISLSEVIYYDFETTGLNPYNDKIIEYAFLEESSEDFINELVNPECKFEKLITDITGIHPDELKDKAPIEGHILSILDFINPSDRPIGFETYLIAHNNEVFDKIFLHEAINRINQYPNTKYNLPNLKINCKHIDTLLLAKKLLPELRSHSLKSLAHYFKVKEGTHRAIDDTECLKEVYHKLLEVMSQKDTSTFRPSHILIENPNVVYNYLYGFK